MNKDSERIREWIRESNLIEGINDISEDKRCLKVWRELQYKNFTVNTILWMHKGIMGFLRPDIAGNFRTCGVQVGGYIAPSFDRVWILLTNWVNIAKSSDNRTDIVQDHIRFEKIHPFEDGNGRVGRMLMNWQLKRNKLQLITVLNDEKQEYYKWFRQ